MRVILYSGGVTVPIVLVATTKPSPELLAHVGPDTTILASRASLDDLGAQRYAARGQIVVSEPDVHHRSPGCVCCAFREDLVDAVGRAVRRRIPPSRVIVVVDALADDVLTVVSTLLSSIEITRRCELDAVIAEFDAVEAATRLATLGHVIDGPAVDAASATVGGAGAALAIADRIVLRRRSLVTAEALASTHAALAAHAGFASAAGSWNATALERVGRLDAWHGAPRARSRAAGSAGGPQTVVLSVDEPLDPDAIDDWLDRLVSRHAARLFRVQGALSVAGHDERTCIYGVRSFATSHSEREHERQRSTASVLAICGVGLDADELAASFRATVAS